MEELVRFVRPSGILNASQAVHIYERHVRMALDPGVINVVWLNISSIQATL